MGRLHLLSTHMSARIGVYPVAWYWLMCCFSKQKKRPWDAHGNVCHSHSPIGCKYWRRQKWPDKNLVLTLHSVLGSDAEKLCSDSLIHSCLFMSLLAEDSSSPILVWRTHICSVALVFVSIWFTSSNIERIKLRVAVIQLPIWSHVHSHGCTIWARTCLH